MHGNCEAVKRVRGDDPQLNSMAEELTCSPRRSTDCVVCPAIQIGIAVVSLRPNMDAPSFSVRLSDRVDSVVSSKELNQ